MNRVGNVEMGVKFKTRSGESYEVIKYQGKSESGMSDLWLCRAMNPPCIEAVFTDWAIADKEEIK